MRQPRRQAGARDGGQWMAVIYPPDKIELPGEPQLKIEDILDVELMRRDVAAGYIAVRRHPEFPDLCIANYTNRATYDDHWDEATVNCRGLIYDEPSGTIVARPYRKFFNLSQHDEIPDGPVLYLEKLDGYLGVAYRRPDGKMAMSSRGSFDSEMAKRANKILARTELDIDRHPGYTDMFEILYPERPLVVDYGDDERLVYTGSIETATGKWRFFDDYEDSAKVYQFDSIQHMLSAPQPHNMEGYVLSWPNEHQLLVKVKFDEYLQLSQVIQGNSARRIKQELSEGRAEELYASIENLPSAARRVLEKTISDIQTQFDSEYEEARASIEPILAQVATMPDRAAIGAYVSQNYPKTVAGMVFTFMKGGDTALKGMVWKKLSVSSANEDDENA